MSSATQERPATAPAKQPRADWETPTNKNGLEALAPLALAQLERGLPRFLMGQGDRILRAMLTACQATPALFDCTPISLFGATIQAAQLGLTIGGPLGEAYFLPFKNGAKSQKAGRDIKEAQLCVGYRGFIQLAHRSNSVRRITPVVVRDGDHFRFSRGLNQDIEHTPARNNTKPATDYYVVIEVASGGKDFETFTVEDAIRFRDRYSTVRNAPDFVKAKSPWYEVANGVPGDGFHAMALKTLIRRLAKRLPLSPEWNLAAGLDETADRDEPQMLGEQHLLPALAPADPSDADRDTADVLRDRMNAARQADPVEVQDAPPAANKRGRKADALPGTTDGNLPD